MFGFQSIENTAVRPNRIHAGLQWRMLVATAAVGVLAGLLLPHVRLHLGLSGHRVLVWMIPVIVARLAFGSAVGATVGGLATACTCLAVGGNIAGGPAQLALIGVSGMVLDGVIGFAERRALSARYMVPLVGLAGALANVVCFIKRASSITSLRPHALWATLGEWGNLLSYATFGLLAGLIGAMLGCRVRRLSDTPDRCFPGFPTKRS